LTGEFTGGHGRSKYAEAAAEVLRVVGVVNTWKLHFAEVGVSPRDIESLAQQIDGEFLLRQRNGFEPERFVVATSRASVVLPTWRGPNRTTAGDPRSAFWSSLRLKRVNILEILAY
jgi:hypothetical protein